MLVKVTKTAKKFKVPTIAPDPFPLHMKSLVNYLDSYSIIENYLTEEQFNAIPGSVRHFLRFFESFEPQTYYVKDDQTVTVADSVNGEVFEENIPLQKFIADALIYAGENVIEEET